MLRRCFLVAILSLQSAAAPHSNPSTTPSTTPSTSPSTQPSRQPSTPALAADAALRALAAGDREAFLNVVDVSQLSENVTACLDERFAAARCLNAMIARGFARDESLGSLHAPRLPVTPDNLQHFFHGAAQLNWTVEGNRATATIAFFHVAAHCDAEQRWQIVAADFMLLPDEKLESARRGEAIFSDATTRIINGTLKSIDDVNQFVDEQRHP